MIIKDFGMPFNDVASDRLYSASDWSEYFKNLVTNGVVAESQNKLLIVQQSVPNKSIQISTGSVILNGAMRIIDLPITLTIGDNTSGNPRIDRVVARLNVAGRKIEFAILQGTPAGTPTAPSLTQNTTTWEISLARIAVANGFSSVVTGNISDEREYSKTLYMASFDDENNLLKYVRNVTVVDSDSNPTTVEYRRSDATLFLKRVYTGPDSNGFYQTVTEQFYLANGTTIYKTIIYTLTFFANGIVDTMSRVVS